MVALHIDRGFQEALWLGFIVAVVIVVGVISARIISSSGDRHIDRHQH